MPPTELQQLLTKVCSGATGREARNARFQALSALTAAGGMRTLEVLLPLALSLNNKPYSLQNYFPFSPIFDVSMPPNILLKTGRQVSKCLQLHGTARVRLANGREVPVSDLHVGDAVLTLNSAFHFETGHVKHIFHTGQQPLFKICTRMGGELTLTANHPLRTLYGYTPVRELVVGSRIAGVRRGGSFGNLCIARERIILTALLLGDGSIGVSKNFNITAGKTCVLDIAKQCIQQYQSEPVRLSKNTKKALSAYISQKGTIAGWMKEDGLWGKRAWEKHIPAWVFDLAYADTCCFLAHLWATDGMITQSRQGNAHITYTSTSRELARDVRGLLGKLGIPSAIKSRSAYCNNKRCHDAYIVRVETRDGCQRFMQQLAVPGKPAIALPETSENNNRDTIPLEVTVKLKEAAAALHRKTAGALRKQGLRLTPKYPLSQRKFAEYLQHLQAHAPGTEALTFLETLQNNDIIWDEILSITPVPAEDTVDIEIEGNHNFVLDGIVSHNSTTIAARGILLANCISDLKILYVTPLYEQVRRFSNNYVRPFIDRSPLRKLWTNTDTDKSVLQRSFRNYSSMLFSFALLDTERIRGIATDLLFADESTPFWSTLTTPAGAVQICDITPGTAVQGFNDNGEVVWTHVLKQWYAGRRRCYRLHTAGGRHVDLTADSFVATTAGCLRVSALIEEIARSRMDAANESNTCPGADAAWHTSRGWQSGSEAHQLLHGAPLLDATRIPLAKIHDLARLRTWSSVRDQEHATQIQVHGILHCCNSGIYLLARPLVSERDQDNNGGKPCTDRRNRLSTDGGVVVRRRREPLRALRFTDDDFLYARVPVRRGRSFEPLDDGSWLSCSSSDVYPERLSAVSAALCQSQGGSAADGGASAVYPANHALQTGAFWQERYGNLYVLREVVPATCAPPPAEVYAPKSPGTCPEKAGTNSSNVIGEDQTPIKLVPDELIAVEDIGLVDVYDVETAGTHSIILGDLAAPQCQDLDPSHIPIIRECMSASDWGLAQFTGTPKTLDNPIEGMWKTSSQAEWFIRCRHCHEWNIPSLEYHIDAMIGPLHDFIGPRCPAIVCHKCRKPLNPRAYPAGDGRWVHRYPDRRDMFVGYHIPQVILPLHYERPDKWRILHAKSTGWGNTSRNVFCNEVLGESVDVGQKLVSETELQQASILGWANDPYKPHPRIRELLPQYNFRVLGVDWGGGGEDEVSFTALALMGYRPDGHLDVLWGKRLLTPNDHMREALEIRHWMQLFGVQLLAHDYTGAGIVRETVLVQAGMDIERIMPIQYVRAASRGLLQCVPPTELHPRQHYRLDKTRSLLYTCQAIKLQLMRFFQYDYRSEEDRGLLNDFLALVAEKSETRLAGDIFTITRNTMRTDDFAHACNLGAAALWHIHGWPDFAAVAQIGRVTSEQIEAAGNYNYGWENDRQMQPFFGQP